MIRHEECADLAAIRPLRTSPRPVRSAAIRRALVLGGGGVAGIAWEIGVLRGIADVLPDLIAQLRAADLIVGTSAGSAVAVQLTSGISIDTLHAAQLSSDTTELEIDFDEAAQRTRLAAVTAGATSLEHACQCLGRLARTTSSVDQAVRRAAVKARLPIHDWPSQPLVITAVDAETGKLQIFTRDSGVELIDAVTASCAVPGIWPPAFAGDRLYIDGAMRSTTNADLATGHDRVLIIAPSIDPPHKRSADLQAELDRHRPGTALIITADRASLTAFGHNPLSPTTRAPATRAGRLQGQQHAHAVGALWESVEADEA